MNILCNINSAADVKELDEKELVELCAELREKIVSGVSQTGGHLSSNLGSVELTVALHRVYDAETDRLVFDVGHQSYAHKLLTGRGDGFATLRQHGGISGFPKPRESECDAFIAGHASDSISVALGMARARTALGEKYDVAAIIGDGALTGGLAYEGLSDAGQSGEPLVVVLNDNGMSIDRNVGGMSQLLANMRVRPGYISFKRVWRRVVGKVPFLYAAFHNVKEWLKQWLLPDNVFDDMGFCYIGPVDGHDVTQLEAVLRWAREMRRPTLVHIMTQKGRGYTPAEQDPETYHGVGPFDAAKGVESREEDDFSGVFGRCLTELAAKDGRIAAITAAMCGGTGLSGFAKEYPTRFFDVGIAEGHAVSMAAGMAKQGMIPVFAVYSTFLQRSYDMLIHDVSLLNLHVVLGVDRAGITGRDGETHQGTFDVSYLRSVPNMAVFCPASYAELKDMLELAVNRVEGPVALRYPRGKQGRFVASTADRPSAVIRQGEDITLVGYGVMINRLLEAADILEKKGISARIVKINLIKPLPSAAILEQAGNGGYLLVAEDVCGHGCVGGELLCFATENGIRLKGAKLLNLGQGIVPHGAVDELLRDSGLDARGIAAAAEELLGKGGNANE